MTNEPPFIDAPPAPRFRLPAAETDRSRLAETLP